MKFKLCYKEYDFKLTLRACKSFYDETGKDLQCVLLEYIQKCSETVDMLLIERMVELNKVCSFNDAAYALYFLAYEENNSVTLDEIRDGMFRVSWLPSEEDNDWQEPWCVVMIDVATKINKYFVDNIQKENKKKAGF